MSWRPPRDATAFGATSFTAVRWEGVSDLHARVYDLAVRLLRGEVVEMTDAHGRHWRATADALRLFLPGSRECAPVIEADAYEVAERFCALAPRTQPELSHATSPTAVR